MTDLPNNPHYDEDEISLLDILVTLAESWKLLVFGPLLAGLLAGALSFLWPKTFESVAILRISEEEAALFHSAPVLDPLIAKFDLLKDADDIQDDARDALKKRLVIAADKKTKLTTLTAKAKTPEAAQALGREAVGQLLVELQPKGKDKALIEKTIAINAQAIDVADDGVEAIQRSLKKGQLSDLAQESAIKNLSAINSDISKRNQENAELAQKLQPRGAEVYVQEPSLPQRKSAPKPSLVVLIAVLASGFVLLLFVMMRKAIWSIKNDPRSASKLEQIKRSLFAKPDIGV
jgi:LPS O-antigen subunit length determinant protein (WzzB/FepE family)